MKIIRMEHPNIWICMIGNIILFIIMVIHPYTSLEEHDYEVYILGGMALVRSGR